MVAGLATGDSGGVVRVWDAATGEPVGVRSPPSPGGEVAVLDASGELIGASEEVWRYLGWNVLIDGRMTRLPVETLGPLPPFPQAAIRARRIVETA